MALVPEIRFEPVSRAVPPRRAAASGWTGVPTGSASAAAAAGSTAALSLDGLLAMQGETDAVERDRTARRRGRDMLDGLAAMQRELLAGGTSGATMARLGELADSLGEADDPALASVVAAIRLRALIELARREGGQPQAG